MGNDEISQMLQRFGFALGREMLKVAKADEAGRDAGHYGGGFRLLAPDGGGRAGQAQRAGAGNTQAAHGLAGQKFAHRAAQDRAAIGPARKRRGARALELHFQSGAFTQQQRAPVAELSGPDTKLMTAVDRSQRLHRQAGVAAQGV